MPSDHGEPAAGSPPAGSASRGEWVPGALLVVILGLVPLLGAWFPRSPEPLQSWDQATHLLLASEYHDAWVREGFPAWHRLRQVSSFYPPFYHVCVAALFAATGVSARAAGLLGGAMLLLLALATGAIARRLHGSAAGWIAAAFVLASPSFAALASQPLVDLTLAALVAVTVWLTVTPRFLASSSRAVALGGVAACGLLTKWVFPVFVAGPLLVRAMTAPRPPVRRWLLAALAAAFLAGAWYVPNAGALVAQARVSSETGRAEGDPSGLALDSLTYYPQAVVMFFPLPLRALILAAGAAAAVARLRRDRPRAAGAGAWVVGSWLAVPVLAFTFIDNKDPRYIAAAAPALAVLMARAWGAIPGARARATVLAAIGLYAVVIQVVVRRASDPGVAMTRGLGALPPRLARLLTLDVQSFVVPDPGGWPVNDVVERIRSSLTPVSPYASIAIVPDLPYVNAGTLRWAARRARYDLRTFHPDRPPSPEEFSIWEYALVKPDGAQGTAHATLRSAAITADLLARLESSPPVGAFESPDGPLLLLRTRHSHPPPDLRPRDQRIDLHDEAAFWHLGDGWSFREPWGRWAVGGSAALRVELTRGVAHRVTVSIAPPESLAGAQVVTVHYAGRRLRSFRLDGAAWAWEDAAMELPAGVATGGIDELRLSFAQVVPAGGADTMRDLAAAVRFVRFEPLAD